jgi:alpha-galactosidase
MALDIREREGDDDGRRSVFDSPAYGAKRGRMITMTRFASFLMALLAATIVYGQKFEGLAPTPPLGWNSWNTFETEIDEALIRQTAEAMIANGMQAAGYNYIVIDDGWEAKERDEMGNIVPDAKRFPGGMKAMGDFLHAKGFKFGIHNCAGVKTCAGFPGGRGHEFQDARAYASWGVDYLKYDWCDHGTADAEETYKTMRDALHAAGRPIVYSLCEWGNNKPWMWAREIGHLWRTTGDVTDCYDCQAVYSVGWKHILDAQVGLDKYAGPDHWNDPDMLEVGNPGLTVAESRSQFSLWCMLAAPLMAGNDVRKMSDEIRDILTNTEVIALDQDPLGKQGYRYMSHPGREIWAKELSKGEWAVCFHNTQDKDLPIRVNWAHLSFLKGSFRIRDLWQRRDIGRSDKEFTARIPTHDVLLLKFSPAKP